MRRVARVATVVLMFSGALGCDNSPSQKYRRRVAARALPAEICAPGTYFGDCFAVPWTECMEIANQLAVICLDGSEKPPEGADPRRRWTWRESMMGCIRARFEIMVLMAYDYDEECGRRWDGKWPLVNPP